MKACKLSSYKDSSQIVIHILSNVYYIDIGSSPMMRKNMLQLVLAVLIFALNILVFHFAVLTTALDYSECHKSYKSCVRI